MLPNYQGVLSVCNLFWSGYTSADPNTPIRDGKKVKSYLFCRKNTYSERMYAIFKDVCMGTYLRPLFNVTPKDQLF